MRLLVSGGLANHYPVPPCVGFAQLILEYRFGFGNVILAGVDIGRIFVGAGDSVDARFFVTDASERVFAVVRWLANEVDWLPDDNFLSRGQLF